MALGLNVTGQADEVCVPHCSSMHVLGRDFLLCLITRSQKPTVCYSQQVQETRSQAETEGGTVSILPLLATEHMDHIRSPGLSGLRPAQAELKDKLSDLLFSNKTS